MGAHWESYSVSELSQSHWLLCGQHWHWRLDIRKGTTSHLLFIPYPLLSWVRSHQTFSLCVQPHLVLGLISQIVKVCSCLYSYFQSSNNAWIWSHDVTFWIQCEAYFAYFAQIQLLSTVNLKQTPELAELLDETEEFEELWSMPAEKILLRWMNFHLRKAGHKRTVSNFTTDVRVSLLHRAWWISTLHFSDFQISRANTLFLFRMVQRIVSSCTS